MRIRQTYDGEKVSFNIARLKKGGETFELVIEPDLAIDFRNGKDADIREILHAEKIFADAKKGALASEETVRAVFKTDDVIEAAKQILRQGEIQLSAEYRERLRDEKKKKIINIIHVNAIDPRSKMPHPMERIENAFQEAKVHIDEHKKAEDQINDIIKKLMPILPIKFATRRIQVHIPAVYAAKMYGTVTGFGTLKKESWLNDGSWLAEVEIPAGLQTDFFDQLNSKTHGNIETKILD